MKKFKKLALIFTVALSLTALLSVGVMASCSCDCHMPPTGKPIMCWCLGGCTPPPCMCECHTASPDQIVTCWCLGDC